MCKLRRELKNCIWISLLLLVALTVMLLISDDRPVNANKIDVDQIVLNPATATK